MSYKLIKPFEQKQKYDFIVKYNYLKGLTIKETETALYALEAWEKLAGDDVIDITEEYEQKQAQKEAERIAKLNLTAADVERAIYKAKGLDFDDILVMLTSNPPEGLDIKALKIELKANNFYRGNPYISQIGALLGISETQLDEFFEINDYTCLLPQVAEE